MRRRLTALAATLAAVAVTLAGCGDKAPGLPKRDATELVRLLKKAQTASDDPQGRCDELLATVAKLEQKVAGLPSNVDRDVRDSLGNGVKNLASSSNSLCSQNQTPTTTTTTPTVTIPTTPPPTTPPTTPPSTQTTPPPTTPTTPPPTTTPPHTVPGNGTGGTGPGNGNGGGEGNRGHGNGNGNGGGGD
jgi:predicted small lipoprotein YifL